MEQGKEFCHDNFINWIDPNDTIPYERNAKKHTDKQIANIANSIHRFGWQQDCVLSSDNIVVIGHGRRAAAIKLGCQMPYHRIDKIADEVTEEAVESIIAARHQDSDHRANVLMVSPHFMPMPFTPMECEPVNWINFREAIKNYDWEKFGKGNINVYWNWSLASSPISAAEATVLNRADVEDAGKIKTILCSSKYKALPAEQKRRALEKYFGHLLGRVESVLPYITRNNPTEKAKEVYYKRIAEA